MLGGILDAVGLGGEAGAAAVTRPLVRVTITPGAPPAGDGGIAGAVGDAAGGLAGDIAAAGLSLLGLGGGAVPIENFLAALTLDRAPAPGRDRLCLDFAAVPAATPVPAPGDAVSLTLGAGAEEATLAFTVAEVARDLEGGIAVVAETGGAVLARLHPARAYAEQGAGAIIRDLCTLGGVTATGPEGAVLPRYVADPGMSAWAHIARLAGTAGLWVVVGDDGTVTLIDTAEIGEPVARIAAGEALLDAAVATRVPDPGAIVLDGAGAADAGGTAWSWLRKTPGPLRAEAGAGVPKAALGAPWLRSADAVSAGAEALLRGIAERQGRSRFLATGQPRLAPGAIVTIAALGAEAPWRVETVRHRLGVAQGFTTAFTALPAGAGAGAGGVGGLLETIGGLL